MSFDVGTPSDYLEFSDAEIAALNPKGLGKLLFIRRETIYLKNIMRQATADRETVEALLATLGIGWPDYLRLLSKRLRRALKAPRVIPDFQLQLHLRAFQTHDTLPFVERFAVPFLCVFDFDRTLTNKQFLPVVQRLLSSQQGVGQFWVCSAHGQPEVIEAFLARQRISIRKTRVHALGSVAAKKRKLYELALATDRFLMVYFDDELARCEEAVLLGYHAYVVHRRAPILKVVGFKNDKVR